MKMEFKLMPFIVPNFVSVSMPAGKREDGIKTLPSLALHELEPDVLSGLCDEFRKDVFAKAMKKDPKEQP
jgi:hypothetical protein